MFKTYSSEYYEEEDSLWERYGAFTSTSRNAAAQFAAWGRPKKGAIKDLTAANHNNGMGTGVYKLYANVVNPMVIDAKGKMFDNVDVSDYSEMYPELMGYFDDNILSADGIAGIAAENGYDGVIIRNIYEGNGDVIGDDVIVFRPEQLKYTDNENPTASEDIRYSTVAQRGRSVEQETMENNRFQRLRTMFDNLPPAWYASQKTTSICTKTTLMSGTRLLEAFRLLVMKHTLRK